MIIEFLSSIEQRASPSGEQMSLWSLESHFEISNPAALEPGMGCYGRDDNAFPVVQDHLTSRRHQREIGIVLRPGRSLMPTSTRILLSCHILSCNYSAIKLESRLRLLSVSYLPIQHCTYPSSHIVCTFRIDIRRSTPQSLDRSWQSHPSPSHARALNYHHLSTLD